jgi:hypothetical protein
LFHEWPKSSCEHDFLRWWIGVCWIDARRIGAGEQKIVGGWSFGIGEGKIWVTIVWIRKFSCDVWQEFVASMQERLLTWGNKSLDKFVERKLCENGGNLTVFLMKNWHPSKNELCYLRRNLFWSEKLIWFKIDCNKLLVSASSSKERLASILFLLDY